MGKSQGKAGDGSGAGHGFGIREGDKSPAGAWPARFREWLDDRGFLGKK